MKKKIKKIYIDIEDYSSYEKKTIMGVHLFQPPDYLTVGGGIKLLGKINEIIDHLNQQDNQKGKE